jgi:bis(5'-adenosyl)-triphosphatase
MVTQKVFTKVATNSRHFLFYFLYPAMTAKFYFGKFMLDVREIFYKTAHSIAFVNLKPVLPGHVLVSPIRVVPKLKDLTPEEITDLFKVVQKVGNALEKHYNVTSLTIAVQDGPEAGQTIPHVHVHIIPRKKHDYANNDDVYNDVSDINALVS